MIILDTHALLWWLSSPSKLSSKSLDTIDNSLQKHDKILVSAITVWEICLLYQNHRLPLIDKLEIWLGELKKFEDLQFIPIDFEIAHLATILPGHFHKDPADRFIVATAMNIGATLITKDTKIRRYKQVKTLW